MIVFSNTTPLIALAGINRLDLLQAVFGRIHLAQEMVDECAASGKILVPELTKLPWVEIVQSTHPTLPSLLSMSIKYRSMVQDKVGRRSKEKNGV